MSRSDPSIFMLGWQCQPRLRTKITGDCGAALAAVWSSNRDCDM